MTVIPAVTAEECEPLTRYYLQPFAASDELVERCMEYQVRFLKRYPDITIFSGLTWYAFGFFSTEFITTSEGVMKPKPLYNKLTEIKSLDITDPRRNKITRRILEIIQYYMDHLPRELVEDYGLVEHCAATWGLEGVFTGGLVGYEAYLAGFYMCPDKIHLVNEAVTEFNIEWVKAVEEIVGKVSKIWYGDHSATFISKRHFQEFCLPYHQKFTKEFADALIVYHNEGEVSHLIDQIPLMGVDAFHIGPDTSLRMAKEKIGDKIALIGNVHPIDVLLRGKPQDVERSCRVAIDSAARGGGFILSTGGGAAYNQPNPPENIAAMVDTARSYGKYPIHEKR
jgi:uroporphyrinogen decarboxylase